MRRLFSMMIALWGCLLAAGADTKITVLSDIHVMAPELIANDGKAWQDFLAAKRTMLDYSTQLFDEQVERLVDGTTQLFMKEEANNETAASLAAKGFVVHAAGGENESGESQTYMAFYEVTSILLKLTGVLDDKLSEYGMSWDMVDDTVRSMLKDISGYGKGSREDRTNDFSLTIDLPKTTPSGITSVEADGDPNAYYTLQGVRVTAPTTKGLYIQNGRLKPVR